MRTAGALSAALARPLTTLRPLLSPTAVSVVRLRGQARFGDEPLAAVYAGNGNNLEYLRSLFFSASESELLEAHSRPWRLAASLGRASREGELLLHELPPAWRAFAPRQAELQFPAWLSAGVALPAAAPGGGALLPRALEREADRHLKRAAARVVYTAAQAAFRRFFHELYQPYIRARFGAQAVLVDETRFLARCRGGRLAQLHADGRWVAGMLILRAGVTLRFGWYAAAAGAPPGVSEALDVQVIRDAWTQGVRQVLLGHTRPCLADGVWRYKRRFGAWLKPARFPQARLGITLNSAGEPALECLRRQPLLAEMKGGLGAWRVEGHGAEASIALHAWPAEVAERY